MFSSRNKGAVRLCGAQADLRMLQSRGTCIYRRVVNKANSAMKGFTLLFLNSQPLSGAILPEIKTCTFSYIPSMCMWAVKALAIFRGCAGSSEPSLLAYAICTITS